MNERTTNKPEGTRSYFASANSGRGFISFFDEVFGTYKRLYIIKGGSGTGKSRLMRDIATEYEKRGGRVEYFHCSSDPASIDGILLVGSSIGVIDGTSPHTADPKYPGARDEIINVGDFWDDDKLVAQSDDIVELIGQKKAAFDSVYHYLRAALEIDRAIKDCVNDAVNYQKLRAAAYRLSREWENGKGYSARTRLQRGITMEGEACFDTFYRMAKKHYIIRDKFGIGSLLLKELIILAQRSGQKIDISYSPLDTNEPDGIYLYGSSTSYTCDESDEYEDKIINMERFVDSERLRLKKRFLKYAAACRASLMEGAYRCLSDVRNLHFRLEEIYISCMDFPAKEAYAESLIKKIFRDL